MRLTASRLIEILSTVPPDTPIVKLAHSDCGLSFMSDSKVLTRQEIIDYRNKFLILGKDELKSLEEFDHYHPELFVFLD